jgi:hypothetical protein
MQRITSKGPREVDAVVHGFWAAHETLDGSTWALGGWSVTHVPSGLRAHSGMTKSDAIAAAEALAKDLNVEEWQKKHGQTAADIMARIGVWP